MAKEETKEITKEKETKEKETKEKVIKEKAAVKKKTKSKKNKRWKILCIIPAVVLGICLIVSVIFNVNLNNKLNKANEDYEKLSANYDSLGKDALSSKNDAYNLQNTIDSLNAEKEVLLETIDDYSAALELAGRNIYLSEYHTLAGKSVNILEAGAVNGIKFYVDASQYYAFYSEEIPAAISYFSNENELLCSYSYDPGKTYFIKLPVGCGYVAISNDGNMTLVSTGIKVEDNSVEDGRYFYVVSEASPVQMSISEAVSKVKEGGTVMVFPGEYEDNVLTRDKEVNIQGVNRDKCILFSYDNDYYNPPLEISAGKVSNMTISAIDDGRGLAADLLSYAVHADFDYMYGRDLTFENCNLTSDYNAGAGIGLRGNGTLTFKDCLLKGYYHGLFVHDSKVEDVGGDQNLVLDSCTLTGINGDVAFVISSCLAEKANVRLLFVNNTLNNLYSPDSENLFAAVNEDLSTHDGFYMGLKNFHLDEASQGNNVDKLNY